MPRVTVCAPSALCHDVAMLLGCGLRRSELVGLESDEVQTRQAIVDMIGKGGRIRTVPILSSEVGDIRPRFVQLDEM